MKIAVCLIAVASLAACNNNAAVPAPSTKTVDSAAAAAPDTIKPMAVDSVRK
jgi:hypothetical protein